MATVREPFSVGATLTPAAQRRRVLLRRAFGLEVATLVYMVAEATIALVAGLRAHSLALEAFGLDSIIELFTAGLLLWRLRLESHALSVESLGAIERRTSRLVGGALFALAGYIVLSAAWGIWSRAQADTSVAGIALAVAALVVMPVLAVAKRRLGTVLGSRALIADGACSMTCASMAAALLVGLLANGLLGWWWADHLAALAFTVWLVREGREAWNGHGCCGGETCAA